MFDSAPGTKLELRRLDFGLRHYLDGILVMPGLSLQLQLVDGQWLEGKYEWTYDEGRPAQFLLLLMFPLPPAALFRWPLS